MNTKGEISVEKHISTFILSKEFMEYGDEAADTRKIAIELMIDFNSTTLSISRCDPKNLGTKSERGFFFEEVHTCQIEECLVLTELIEEAVKIAKKIIVDRTTNLIGI